jgi:predicted Zn-dependent peptidase
MQYLASGRTSVLNKDLVKEKKIAVAVQEIAGFPGDKYPSLAAIIAVPAPGHTNAECEKDIFDAIEKAKTNLISTEELGKIKAQAKANFINQLKGNQGMAFQLAGYEIQWGDWRQLFKELDRINAVTPEDVQRVAKMYLTEKNRNVVMMNTAKS